MTQIPIAVADISAEWLSAVLSERHPGTAVRSFIVEDAHAGTTGRALLRLAYANNPGLPERLFVKLPPDDAQQRAFVAELGMGKKEARFYRDLAAELPLAVPHCYHASFNEAGDRYIILLENLEDRGCTFRNASTNYSLDYIRGVLDAFACLHGRFWDSPRFAADLDWIRPPDFHPMGPKLVEKALQQYAASMPQVFEETASFYLENVDAVHALWNQGVATLVHGDIHDGNLYYDPELAGQGGPGFLDWGVMSRTSCMRDVAYFLAGTPTPEDRRQHQQQLLDDYFSALESQLAGPIDRAALHEQYQWHIVYVWVAAVTTLAMGSEWQPLNYVSRTMERLHLALADNQGLAALKSALG